jgi:superfamily II DNA helicase RecQ
VEPIDETPSQNTNIPSTTEELFQLSMSENRERISITEGLKPIIIYVYIDILDPHSLEISAIMLKTLRKMFHDDNSRFKSTEQAEATREILKRKSDLLVILPTGGGKTLTYQLPIFLEENMTTVVIVPFVVLVKQVEEQCRDLNLSYEIWKKGEYNSGNSRVIITGVEHAITAEFQDLLIQLESTNRLARIVIDECHTVLTQKEFRTHMRRVAGVVRCVSTQLVLLTATLPPTMEEKVRIILGCESLKVIRKREDRKELKYSVRVMGNDVKTMEDLNYEIGQLILQTIETWTSRDRALVYCLQTKWAEELTDYLNENFKRQVCGVYHAKMEEKERERALSDWKSGKTRFLIATSALGAGLDYDAVRLVIHQGRARNLIDFGQESGRGGRDGKPAQSVTLFWEGIEKLTEWITDEGKNDMIHWIKASDCRKKMLSIYLHGSGEDCLSQRDGEVCDICEKKMKETSKWNPGTRSSQKRGRDMESMEISDGIDVKEMIKELTGNCTRCWVNGYEDVVRHQLSRCR